MTWGNSTLDLLKSHTARVNRAALFYFGCCCCCRCYLSLFVTYLCWDRSSPAPLCLCAAAWYLCFHFLGFVCVKEFLSHCLWIWFQPWTVYLVIFLKGSNALTRVRRDMARLAHWRVVLVVRYMRDTAAGFPGSAAFVMIMGRCYKTYKRQRDERYDRLAGAVTRGSTRWYF